MFGSHNRPVCGAICDYCHSYYPNKRALTIHEYFHTSDDISTLLSYSEISKDSYKLPKAHKSYSDGVNGKRVSELFCSRTNKDYPNSNHRETKAVRMSQDMEEMLYLTHKYPLKTSVKSTNRRYSPYPTKNRNDFGKKTSLIQYSTDAIFENCVNNSAADLHVDHTYMAKSNFQDEKERNDDDDDDQDSSNSSELTYSRSDHVFDYSPLSDNMDELELRKSFSDSEIITTINSSELSKLCNFNSKKFGEDADLNRLEKLSSSFKNLKTFKNSIENSNSKIQKDSKLYSPKPTLISTENRDFSRKNLYKQMLISKIKANAKKFVRT